MQISNQHYDSSFLSVLNTWRDYYDNMDEGLGTTYERFILHHYFERIKENFQINSVLEVPSFGMTGISGINSMWWAAQGIRPTVLDNNEERISLSKQVWDSIPLPVSIHNVENFHHLPYGNKSFDFSWNFASIWFIEKLDLFVTELDRVTAKVIFICVPNRLGIGYKLREHYNKPIPSVINTENIRYTRLVKSMQERSWQLWENGYFDIPPWPDIAMKKEELFQKVGLGFLHKNSAQTMTGKRMCIVDFFNGKSPELEKQVLKFSFLESAPFPLKQLWAHHRYMIFTK